MRSWWLRIAVVVCSVCSVAAVVSDGFEKVRDTETAKSSKISMVPLTLIHGAKSKGAAKATHAGAPNSLTDVVQELWNQG